MICCVLLASGFGRRFGSNKLLYEVGGKPMAAHALELVKELSTRTAAGHEIRAVVVSQYPEIEAQAERMGMHAVHNPDAAEGIAASVRYGTQAAGDAEWIAFFTADQPDLRADTVWEFLCAAVRSGQPMASVMSQGEPGNPTLFHQKFRAELLGLTGDTGGRKIMKRCPEQVFWFEIPESERRDIDERPRPNPVDKSADFG